MPPTDARGVFPSTGNLPPVRHSFYGNRAFDMKRYKGIYFDNAATSYPKPRAVTQALIRTIAEEGGNPGRSTHPLSLRGAYRIDSARETIAAFFGMPDERGVIFTKNATEALNLAIAVFTRNGGHVLCDDMAHNALVRPLYALRDAGKITLSFYSMQAKPTEIERKIRNDTVLLCATHASNICSLRIDAAMTGALCKRHGIAFVLDASQSAGHMPIHLPSTLADAVCIPAHKGLCGIMGAGAVLFSELREDLPPFLSGGSGAYSRSKKMPRELPEHFEAGTLPLPAIAAFEAGVRFTAKRGIFEIAYHAERLEKRLLAGLSVIRGIHLPCLTTGGGILSFTHERHAPHVIAARLADADIAVRAGLHCAPLAHRVLGTEKTGTVRISLGNANTESECDKFLYRLNQCLKE